MSRSTVESPDVPPHPATSAKHTQSAWQLRWPTFSTETTAAGQAGASWRGAFYAPVRPVSHGPDPSLVGTSARRRSRRVSGVPVIPCVTIETRTVTATVQKTTFSSSVRRTP